MKILFLLSSNVMAGSTISFLNFVLNIDKTRFVPIVVIPSQWNSCQELETVLSHYEIEFYHTLLYESVLPQFNVNKSLKWFCKYIVLHFQKRKSAKQLEELIVNIKPDIIHTNVGIIHEGFHLAQKYKIPHIWHIREYQTEDFNWYIYPSFKKFCSFLKQSYVITITKALQTYFDLDCSDKALTIYNGIFRRDECEQIIAKEPYFLMACRVSSEKGHADVIKAFSYFSRKDEYRLVIAGFGNENYIRELKDLSKEYRCEDRIDFLGFQKDIKPLMSKAKALVVASYNEGFGRMTAEAAFCGTLVIGRNTAGTKEILDKTGGFPFLSTEEMTAQMEIIAALDEEQYLNKAGHAQIMAMQNYSIESNVHNISNLYQSIINTRKMNL